VLRGEVTETALALRDLYPDTNAVVAELRRKAVAHEERGWFTQLLKDDGTTIWKSDRCPNAVAAWPVARERIENLVQIAGYRFARRRVTGPAEEPFHVRIGMPTAFLDASLDSLTRVLLPIGGALALLTPLAGYWLALRATRPVGEILAKADSLKPTRLGDRLVVRDTSDELDQLSRTINRLLDDVAGHIDRQQQFVADAAHELRGPLAAIQIALEVATSKDRPAHDYQATIADVLQETRHLAKLTNDLLLLADGESVPGITRSRLDLAPLILQTASMFAGAAEDRGITLYVDAAMSAIVAGDAQQLRQVCSNLVDNALRFTGRGGRVGMSLAVERASGEAVLTVSDTGSGIEPQHLPRVFDRFFQADAARDRGDELRGGGLGLAICRAIVEGHEGRITVSSQTGQGTSFTVRLPLAQSRARPAQPA
jgi:signal transduction histidine kinase